MSNDQSGQAQANGGIVDPPQPAATPEPNADGNGNPAPAAAEAIAAMPPVPPPKEYIASMKCGSPHLPRPFAEKVLQLEKLLERRVLLLVEGNSSDFMPMFPPALRLLRQSKSSLPEQPIAVLLDSWGGYAKVAYALAKLVRSRCGSFIVVVPRIAKSAATLFALGSEKIVLGEDAELGPLDAQFFDPDVEEASVSALDTVQAVEQLEDSAVEVAIKMLRYLSARTRKKYNLLIEHALHFSAQITQPLFNKIDAVRYSRQHRMLKEAQDYAERLLQPKFSEEEAKAIAKDLVRQYPTHDFLIDREEAAKIGTLYDSDNEEIGKVGLQLANDVSPALNEVLDWFSHNIGRTWAAGFVVEKAPAKGTKP